MRVTHRAVRILLGLGGFVAPNESLVCCNRTAPRFDEAPQLGESLGILRCHAKEPSVPSRLPHVEVGLDSSRMQSSVHTDVVGEEPVACSGQEYDRWKPGEITEEG